MTGRPPLSGLKLYHDAVDRVPAYARFLFDEGVPATAAQQRVRALRAAAYQLSQIELRAADDPAFFPRGVKHRYTGSA